MSDTSNVRRLLAGIFNDSWYLENNPDVAAADIEPLDHYLFFGADEGRDPHLLFRTSWYLAQNPDVGRIKINPLLHYVLYGASEGRDPHPLFDSSWYLENNARIGQRNPLEHYLTIGATEARPPHPLFDLVWYLKRNPDVKLFGGDPLSHYLTYGEKEGRNPNPLFDVDWYAKLYPFCAQAWGGCLVHYITAAASSNIDPHPLFNSSWYIRQLGANLGQGVNPLAHYLAHGLCNKLDPHRLFDAKWYLTMYPEVSSGGVSPLVHYLEEGASYGAEPHPLFRANWYKEHYMKNDWEHLNPLVHYILHGSKLNFDPNPMFSAEWYRRRYEDANASFMSPLEHYVTKGKKKGYATSSIADVYKDRVIQGRIISAEMTLERRCYIAKMSCRPLFLVVIDSGSGDQMIKTRNSVYSQIYKAFDVVDISDIRRNMEKFRLPEAYLVWLQAGDILNPYALYHFADAINRDASAEILYGDEEVVNLGGDRVTPFYKPAWSPDYLYSFNYIGSAACYKMNIVERSLAESMSSFEFLLKASDESKVIVHIREMILRSPDRRFASESLIRADLSILNEHAESRDWDIQFVPAAPFARVYQPALLSDHSSRLSVILFDAGAEAGSWTPTRVDANGEQSIISEMRDSKIQIGDVWSIRSCSLGFNRENGGPSGTRPSRHACFAEAFKSVAAQVTGDYILFLDKQYQFQANNAISDLVACLRKPDAGAAGSMIMSENDRIVAFGQILCDDVLQNLHFGREQDFEDYFFGSTAVRNARAVSLNGLVTPRAVFEKAHGFDKDIRFDLIAADYCLRLADQGLSVACVPSAKLKKRSREAVDEGAWLQNRLSADPVFFRRWSHKLLAEPYYNEFSLSTLPATYDARPQGFPGL